MKLAVLGVIVGVYWYCCCFQSSICGEQSLLVPTWIQPFVCLPEEGKGTRQPLWFTVGPAPAWLWPCSKLVIISPRSSSLPLSFPLSLCSLYLSLAPSSPSFIFSRIALFLHSSLFIFYAALLALLLLFSSFPSSICSYSLTVSPTLFYYLQ